MAAPTTSPTTSASVSKIAPWVWWILVLAAVLMFVIWIILKPEPFRNSDVNNAIATEAPAGAAPSRDAEMERGLSSYERANRSPPLYLDLEPGKTEARVEIELTPHEWSREIVTAMGTSWRCDVRPPNGCRVWFRSEESPREYATETPVQNFGIWRGVFRLKGIGSEPQKAAIAIVKSQ